MTTPTSDPTQPAVLADLGGGLIMRRATAADADALAAFNAVVHSDSGPDEPDRFVAAFTRDLLARPHPTVRPDLCTIVEDTHTGQIVSSLILIPQTWSYGGIPFGVGRIELVGTHPDYRRRGLVRRQMDVAHRWSAERGDLVQAITGIPWYYRQFGYEMALSLSNHRALDRWRVPDLPAGAADPYRLRAATPADLPLVSELDARGRRRYLVSCDRDIAAWRYELAGHSEQSAERHDLRIVETAGDESRPIGFVAHHPWLWRGALGVNAFELASGTSWLAVAPSVLRGLRKIGDRYAERKSVIMPAPGDTAFGEISLLLGDDHPAYQALAPRLRGTPFPYAWYVRVPDIPAFLRQIAPVLETRLSASVASGYSGELKLSFYQSGGRLAFDGGKLATAEPWTPLDTYRDADAAFPPLTFLQLLFGFRSLAELRRAFPDCWTKADSSVLLDILVPRMPSAVWPLS